MATSERSHSIPGDAPRPWEVPGAVRRDCLPHRGNRLLRLAAASVVCGLLSFFLFFAGFIGLLLAWAALFLTGRDLAAMKFGRMDPFDQGRTKYARKLASGGIVLCLLGMPCNLALLWFMAPLLLLSLDGGPI